MYCTDNNTVKRKKLLSHFKLWSIYFYKNDLMVSLQYDETEILQIAIYSYFFIVSFIVFNTIVKPSTYRDECRRSRFKINKICHCKWEHKCPLSAFWIRKYKIPTVFNNNNRNDIWRYLESSLWTFLFCVHCMFILKQRNS